MILPSGFEIITWIYVLFGEGSSTFLTVNLVPRVLSIWKGILWNLRAGLPSFPIITQGFRSQNFRGHMMSYCFTEVQETASSAVSWCQKRGGTVESTDLVAKIANLGAAGAHKANIERDFHTLLKSFNKRLGAHISTVQARRCFFFADPKNHVCVDIPTRSYHNKTYKNGIDKNADPWNNPLRYNYISFYIWMIIVFCLVRIPRFFGSNNSLNYT